jgi:hypothetical protein
MNKKEFHKSKSALYGIIISIVSIVALTIIFAVRDSVQAEYEKIAQEEGCFQGDAPDPRWKNLTADEKKAKSRKCMTALNKVTQVNYGPYVFSFTLILGIFLFILAFINARNSHKLMEDLENDN